jgi:hypothetical protein
VGAGDSYIGPSHVANLTLLGGRYFATARTGIGSSSAAEIDHVILANDIELDCWASSDWCLNGSEFTAQNLVLYARINGSVLLPMYFTADSSADLEVHFLSVSYPDNLTFPIFHAGNVRGVSQNVNITVKSQSGWSRTVFFHAASSIGFMISVPDFGDYSLALHEADGALTDLCSNDSAVFSVKPLNGFFVVVQICQHNHLTPFEIAALALASVALVVLVITVIIFVKRRRARAALNQPVAKYALLAEDGDSRSSVTSLVGQSAQPPTVPSVF